METLTSERTYTITEYLDREDRSLQKHEFHNGKIISVSGASFIHNAIAVNVLTALKIASKGKNNTYHVTNSDTKIWIEAIQRFVYPDAAVISNSPIYFKERRDIVTNPLLVIEILSPGTKKKDRASKFDLYRTLPSLEEYVLIEQDHPIISTFSASRNWQEIRTQGMDQLINLGSMNIALTMADIYEGVDNLRA